MTCVYCEDPHTTVLNNLPVCDFCKGVIESSTDYNLEDEAKFHQGVCPHAPPYRETDGKQFCNYCEKEMEANNETNNEYVRHFDNKATNRSK